MAGNSAFQLVEERGWRRGLGNLLRAGFHTWWKTNTWWVHALIWTGVINVMLAAILWGADELNASDGVGLFCLFSALFPTVAVIIIMQGAIVGEKQLGTAAWVLSKPVSRQAYIISKLVPNAVNMVASMLFFPAVAAFIQFMVVGAEVSLLGFFLGWAVVVLNMLFYLTLTVMLGAMMDKRGGVIGIALGFLFGQQYLVGMIPPLAKVLPWTLIFPTGDEISGAIAPGLMLGQTPTTVLPVIFTLLAVGVFVAVALWQFEKQEL